MNLEVTLKSTELTGRRRGLSGFISYRPDMRGQLARSKAAEEEIAQLCEKASQLSLQPQGGRRPGHILDFVNKPEPEA